MGIITDYVVADIDEAPRVLASFDPTKHWAGVEAKSIDTVKLASLGLILSQKPMTLEAFDVYHQDIKELISSGDEGPWMFLVPQQLTSRLARLEKAELPKVATQWHAREEFKLDQWEQAEVMTLLQDLHELAKRAMGMNKPMLLFVSL